MVDNEIIIQGLCLEEVMGFIHRKSKRYQAISLNDLESVISKDTEEYSRIRKIILDGYNEYTRSVLNVIFGDIEYISQHTNNGKFK